MKKKRRQKAQHENRGAREMAVNDGPVPRTRPSGRLALFTHQGIIHCE